MSGLRFLYISQEGKVFRVPQPKNNKFKAIRDLSGQVVLKVMLYYETEDRIPSKLLFLEFDRIQLDSEGGYELIETEINKVIGNAMEYIFVTPEEMAKRHRPFVIPLAPSLPDEIEKKALYGYLELKLPLLSKDAPFITEKTINKLKQIHDKKLTLVKEANRLRNENK
ncbi:hypothetical protein [Sporosarcina luteola]|uniref:hypothetical protein n=1 Tax=Sporosarcina luteola TaxID=582850 RepID=UPI002040C6AC|nr:hypothetical protein [Sporosarcina luteola]MCM3711483.1 hypothetical protein [Sporosarcina luteola]